MHDVIYHSSLLGIHVASYDSTKETPVRVDIGLIALATFNNIIFVVHPWSSLHLQQYKSSEKDTKLSMEYLVGFQQGHDQ